MDFPPMEVAAAIVRRYAALLERLGEEIGTRPMVLPDGESFPDTFHGDEPSTRALVHRMQHHAGMDDIPLRVQLISDGPGAPQASCKSGACSTGPSPVSDVPRVMEDADGWVLNIPEPELAHPVVLTTMVARGLAHVFLVETLEEGRQIESPVEVTGDLAAVLLGFGALLLEGSYMYSKSCGGPQVAQATRLTVGELAVAYALFVELGRHSPRRAVKELGTTQRAVFTEARDLLGSNRRIVEKLARAPGDVARGELRLEPARPWLLRVVGRRRPAAAPASGPLPDDLSLAELDALATSLPPSRPAKAAAPDPRHDELRALVDEALSATRADAE